MGILACADGGLCIVVALILLVLARIGWIKRENEPCEDNSCNSE